MLGHTLYERLGRQFELFATIRADFESIKRFGIFEKASIVENIDAANETSIRSAIEKVRPDVVINAVGIIKQRLKINNVIQTLSINSILPHRLAELSEEFGFYLIAISTDCVFDGRKGNYSEHDLPNAHDLYGMSKILGEVRGERILTLRTSIIGREFATRHSIVEWFLANRGEQIKGFTQAIYSGLTAGILADVIAKLITEHSALNGIYHVSGDPISKYDLLKLMNKHYRADVEIVPSDEVVIDRSLDSSLFRSATQFSPPDWDSMIEQMAGSPIPYDKWQA